jgi:hypothetical protein
MFKILSFSLNAPTNLALHVVKCVFQLLGGYVSTNISNSPTKFFDSVACASKNCVFEAWISTSLLQDLETLKEIPPVGCSRILSNKQLFEEQNVL